MKFRQLLFVLLEVDLIVIVRDNDLNYAIAGSE